VQKRVLGVDDDSAIRRMLGRILTPHYEVVLAANGVEALAEIHRQRPDLLLLDLRMPIMDGWQLIARLESEGMDIPVVVMSAESQRLWPVSPLVKAQHHKLDGVNALLAACSRALAQACKDCSRTQ
jgi:CheY-like chemotaxis protein